MSTRYQPLQNRIVVKRLEQTTKGKILLPESAKSKSNQGTVVAVGPGFVDQNGKTHPVDLKVGQTVLFSAFAGTEVDDSAEEGLLILSQEDLLAVVE